jgi:hypothetical protein
MENKKKLEIYLEDNTDLIFGTECLYGNLDVTFRERLENGLISKQENINFKEDDNKESNSLQG